MIFLNIPNILTLLRIALVPVFLTLYLKGAYDWAFAFFFIAGITDFLDGMIARGFNRKTPVGAFLDPAADKFLMNACYFVFYWGGEIPLILTALVFARDLLIVAGLCVLKFKGIKVVFSPSRLSKLNTLLQLLVLFLVFLMGALSSRESYWFTPEWAVWIKDHLPWLFLITAAMTILSGIQYTVIGLRINRSGDAAISVKKN